MFENDYLHDVHRSTDLRFRVLPCHYVCNPKAACCDVFVIKFAQGKTTAPLLRLCCSSLSSDGSMHPDSLKSHRVQSMLYCSPRFREAVA